MANIKKNENTLKNLFERFPSLEGKLRAFANLRDGSLHYVRLAAIQTAFRADEIDDMLIHTGFSQWVLTDILRISKRSLYNFKNLCMHCLENCPCVKGKKAAEIVALFEEKNSTIGEQILEDLREKFPTFSIRDFYAKELPAPEKKKSEVPAISDEAWEIINKQEKFQNQTGLFGLWFSEADNINFLYDEMPLDLLRQAKEVADAASANIARILEERENSNG